MRFWFYLLFLIVQSIISAQVISDITSQVIPGSSKIEITYMFRPLVTDEKYTISVYYTIDYGKEIKLKSVTGDVGGGISIQGQKTIIWDVFDQHDVFQGKNIRFKVVAERQTTFGETIGGAVVSTGIGIWYLFAGSDETQSFVNGLVLFGGYPKHNFKNDTYKYNKENDILKLSQAWSAGFRYQAIPLIFSLEYDYSKYDLDFNLKSGEKFIARYESISGDVNFTFLPILKQIIPSAGVGYHYGILHDGEYKTMTKSSGFYINGMVEVNLAFLTLGASYRRSITSEKDRDWDQIIFTAGIRFYSTSSSENQVN